VYPTPTIGMVGLLEDITHKMTLDFKNEEDVILLIGKVTDSIGSSEYVHKIHKIEHSSAPYFNLDEEYELQAALMDLIKKKSIVSAHDVSEGGLITTLLESGFHRKMGFEVNDESSSVRKDAFWFGEGQGRVVVSCTLDQLNHVEAL